MVLGNLRINCDNWQVDGTIREDVLLLPCSCAIAHQPLHFLYVFPHGKDLGGLSGGGLSLSFQQRLGLLRINVDRINPNV